MTHHNTNRDAKEREGERPLCEDIRLTEPGLMSDDHPDPEDIAAYVAGELDPEREERLQQHLAECSGCVDLLLLLGDKLGEEPAETVDFEKELVWARLLAEKAEEEASDARRSALKIRQRKQRELWGLAAAMLLMVVLPLGGFSVHQNGIIGELTRPQPNVSIHDVLEMAFPRGSDGVTRGAAPTEPNTFNVPPGTEFYTVVFPVNATREDITRVEIFDSQKRLVWSGAGLEVDEFGYATLGLSRRFLEAGTYLIRVIGQGTEKNLIGDYPIVIHYLPSS